MLTGTGSVANYQAALRSVRFVNSSDNPSTLARTVSYTVNDGATNSNTVTSTVNVTAVNDAPVLATGSVLNYTENDPATAIDTLITVNDVDNATLASATVSILRCPCWAVIASCNRPSTSLGRTPAWAASVRMV